MNVKIRNKFIEIKYSVSNGLDSKTDLIVTKIESMMTKNELVVTKSESVLTKIELVLTKNESVMTQIEMMSMGKSI